MIDGGDELFDHRGGKTIGGFRIVEARQEFARVQIMARIDGPAAGDHALEPCRLRSHDRPVRADAVQFYIEQYADTTCGGAFAECAQDYVVESCGAVAESAQHVIESERIGARDSVFRRGALQNSQRRIGYDLFLP